LGEPGLGAVEFTLTNPGFGAEPAPNAGQLATVRDKVQIIWVKKRSYGIPYQ
jgi:hypothetical protein